MSPIYLAVPLLDLFGAGTCGKYLVKEFSKRRPTFCVPMGEGEELFDAETKDLMRRRVLLEGDIHFPLLQFAGPDMGPQIAQRGAPTAGYVFFEEKPTAENIKNLRRFDVLIAGSTWNASLLREAGLQCSAVPQGVDTEIFRPAERSVYRDSFVIYSGGKFEHRKAQDLVIRAVKVLQKRHPEILLVASWFNAWSGADGYDLLRDIRHVGLPLLNHLELAHWMNQTDVGLFPNRAEGGTNLVMMDYLACGKPVVANTSTGQKDVLEQQYSIGIEGSDEELVENMIEGVESLMVDSRRMTMGKNAAAAMKNWSWERTADGIEKAIGFVDYLAA